MNLYMVKYKQWNSYFSENYERERLSVENNKYEAIAKVKETVSKDAREFAAEKISAVFGYEVKISGDGVQMCSTHFKELKQRICELEEEFQNCLKTIFSLCRMNNTKKAVWIYAEKAER